MPQDDYCHDLLRRTNLEGLLALTFSGAPTHRRLLPLYALQQELVRSVDQASDPAIAHTRLQWWGDELRRAVEGRANHPVAIALASACEGRMPLEALLEMVTGVAQDIDHQGFESVSELADYCYRTGGLPARVAAELNGADEPAGRAAQQLGSADRLVILIRDAPELAARGRIYIPGEVLRRQRVDAEDLSRPVDSSALAAAVAEVAREAEQRYRQSDQLISEEQRSRLLPLLLQSRLRRRELRRLLDSGRQLAHAPAPARGIKLLWWFWRWGRQERKRARRASQPRG